MDLNGVIGNSTVSGWDIALALAIIIAGWIASIFARRATYAVLTRLPNISESSAILVARIVKYALFLLAIGIGLSFLGASIQPVLAIALIVCVIMVLALRGIADNFAAGVVLQTRHPIAISDEIEVAGHIGTVRELNGRSVIIRTNDGRTVHVPNATLLQQPVVNHSEAGVRRHEVEVRMPRGDLDVAAIADLLGSAASRAQGVHAHEPVRVVFTSLSAERVTARVGFWHHPQHQATVSSAVVTAIDAALADTGVSRTVTSELPDPPLTRPDPT